MKILVTSDWHLDYWTEEPRAPVIPPHLDGLDALIWTLGSWIINRTSGFAAIRIGVCKAGPEKHSSGTFPSAIPSRSRQTTRQACYCEASSTLTHRAFLSIDVGEL